MSLAAEAEALVHELFRTDAGRRDPFPRLHRLRQVAPVHRSEVARAWILTRHEDCRAVLRDPRFGKRFAETMDGFSGSWRDHESLTMFSRMMLQLDTPQHTRLRQKVSRTFTARRILELRPRIEQTVAELLEESTVEDVDLLETLAFRLPITVIGDLLGIDRAQLASFRQPAQDLTVGVEIRLTAEQREAADAAARFFDEVFTEIVASRREAPTGDLLSDLVNDDGPDPLTDRELLDMFSLLLIAGFETTTNVISGGLLALHDQPEQLAILRSGAQAEHVYDELLRHQASVQFVNRVALEDVELGGHVIPAGEQVFVMLGAANRDPAVYDDPDRLDFTRERPRHLTFGGGIHHCVGAALARLELDVLLEQLGARFSAVQVPGARPRFRDTLTFRAVESLPLQLQSVAEAATCPVTGARPGHEDDAAWRDEQRRLLEQAPPELSSEEVADRVALLEIQPLLSGCRPSELVSLATTAYVLTFEPDEVIIHQGADPDDVLLVMEGAASVLVDGEHVATCGPDELVGERGVVTSTPRAATVVATEHTAALVLSRTRFRDVLEGNPAAAATMLAVTAARYAGTAIGTAR